MTLIEVKTLLLMNMYREKVNKDFREGYEKGIEDFYKNIKQVLNEKT